MFLCAPVFSLQPQTLYVSVPFNDRLRDRNIGRKRTAKNPIQFHRNMLTLIYGLFLLVTILLIADQGNFSAV